LLIFKVGFFPSLFLLRSPARSSLPCAPMPIFRVLAQCKRGACIFIWYFCAGQGRVRVACCLSIRRAAPLCPGVRLSSANFYLIFIRPFSAERPHYKRVFLFVFLLWRSNRNFNWSSRNLNRSGNFLIALLFMEFSIIFFVYITYGFLSTSGTYKYFWIIIFVSFSDR
jgi:hypothetical protein